MCGVAGAVALRGKGPGRADELLPAGTLARMLATLHHRGPEATGAWRDRHAVLGHARLSIVDLEGGRQPLADETGTRWAVVNGEVFNHVELRADLRRRGHLFRTHSDSEVVLHLHEEHGVDLLGQLNGQYAMALWDADARRLLLARDRLGVRPLFWTVVDGVLLFASEVKALLADPRVGRRPDLRALDEVFTYWAPLPGRTMLEGIHELPAGHYLLAGPGMAAPRVVRYWGLDFGAPDRSMTDEDASARLRELLVDATRLRLRADVPVGVYLSGGLDSSAIAAAATSLAPHRLESFSVAFADRDYDERPYQELVARRLGTVHHVVECRSRDIAEVLPDVVRHAETPLLRTAPAPLFLLSELVRRAGLKVVLTGEGADELFAGYDIFKEMRIRRLWARDPASRHRPALLPGLYGWLPGLRSTPQAALEAFFRQGLEETADPAYSHLLRWRNTARLKRLFSAEVRAQVDGFDSRAELDAMLDPALAVWDPLSQAQYLEVLTFLTPYLLASQGDRVAMAHSVEGRFPFLDHRVVDLATRIPPRARLRGFDEKRVLKRAVSDLVPAEVVARPKQPYRAPVSAAFCGPEAPDYVDELLSPAALRAAGLFDPAAVGHLVAKCRSGRRLGELDDMALVGVLSAQLWHSTFVAANPAGPPAVSDVRLVDATVPAPT